MKCAYTFFSGTYQFNYDGANQLTTTSYDGFGNFSTAYNYDKNGNIKHIERYGNNSDKTFDKIDDITLSYKGNRLLTANDKTGYQYQNNGFTDNGSFESKEYEYDHNGNMTGDLNKKITRIEYNFQNLPESITLVNGETLIKYFTNMTS